MRISQSQYGHTVFEDDTKPWSGCGFTFRHTRLEVRRVERDGVEEAQIEIRIDTRSMGGRLTTASDSFLMNPDEAEQFAKALLTPKGTPTLQ